jgi:hypothetical protein
MATHRDIAGSQQAVRRGSAGGLAPEAADLRRSCRQVVAQWTAESPSQGKYASDHTMIPMLSSAELADLLGEGAATVRCGLRTARHRVLPGEPTGDTLQFPWTPHHMP